MRTALTTALLWLFSASLAWADGGRAADPGDVLVGAPLPATYEESLEDARGYASKGRWGLASDLYEHAYAQRETQVAMLGIAEAAMHLKDHLRVLRATALLQSRFFKTLTSAESRAVASWESQARANVASVDFVLKPKGASVFIDGKPASASAQYLLPGVYSYSVEAAGHEQEDGTLTVAAGETRTVNVALLPTTNTGVESARLLDAAVPPVRVRRKEGGLVWTWVALGGTVVFFASAIVMDQLAEDKLGDLLATCEDERCGRVRAVSLVDDSGGETLETLANVSIGLGIAGAVATGVLMVIEWPREVETDEVVQLRLGPSGLGLRAAF